MAKKKYKIRIARVLTLLAAFIAIVSLIIILSVKSGSEDGENEINTEPTPVVSGGNITSTTPDPLPSLSPTPTSTPVPTLPPTSTPVPTLPPLTPSPTPVPTPTASPTPALKKDPKALTKPTKKMIEGAATGKLSGNSVNLRQGPSVSTPIIASGLSKNAELTVYQTSDKDFFFVKVNSLKKYGYISKKYVKLTSDFNQGATPEPSTAPAPEGTVLGKVTASKIALRSDCDSDSKTIREFTNKPSVYIHYKQHDYYYVEVAGTKYKGFMYAKYVKASGNVPSK